MILRYLFLATSNALINCISGFLKLSFGNMTLELTIFNTCKQPRDEDDVHEVDLIETFNQEQFNKTCFLDPLEACLVNSCDFNFDENFEIEYIHCLLESTHELETSDRKLKFEEFPPYEIKLL